MVGLLYKLDTDIVNNVIFKKLPFSWVAVCYCKAFFDSSSIEINIL